MRMGKMFFCISEKQDADQLCGNRTAEQRLCFRYIDSTIPLLSKSKISSLYPSSVAAQPGLCGTWSETPKTGFLTTRLISCENNKDSDQLEHLQSDQCLYNFLNRKYIS